jgi:hypothetical protein
MLLGDKKLSSYRLSHNDLINGKHLVFHCTNSH